MNYISFDLESQCHYLIVISLILLVFCPFIFNLRPLYNKIFKRNTICYVSHQCRLYDSEQLVPVACVQFARHAQFSQVLCFTLVYLVHLFSLRCKLHCLDAVFPRRGTVSGGWMVNEKRSERTTARRSHRLARGPHLMLDDERRRVCMRVLLLMLLL